MQKKVRVGRCPSCLKKDTESILIEEDGMYRCPNCCFKGKEEDVLREYRKLHYGVYSS